jgi:peptide/nickel transport system ATP-binding protein
MGETLLEIRNLTINFKTEEGINRGVENVNFSVGRGEVLGIVGESGSGKSVSSLSVMGLLPSPPAIFDSGEILFTGKTGETVDILKLKEQDIRKLRGNEIAMIFQEPMTSLNPVMRCGDQVAEALMLHKGMNKADARKRTIELFREVMLPRPEKIYDSYPHLISGGQKQRVMIAMAISCEPSLLIADEPTTALDVTVQKTILEILLKLREKYGMSIIFITHDLGVIAEIAQRVIVMYRGKIMEEGDIHKIFSAPEHPYTQGLIACRPPVDKRYKRLPVVADFTEGSGNFKYREITPDERAGLHNKLYSRPPLMEIHSLETVFVQERSLLGRAKSVVKAVNNVSFEIYKGETLGLVGESGCGKTALGRTMLRMIEAQSGEVIYKGRNILNISRKEMKKLRREVQIIFQDPYSSLNPRLTIGEAILEPMTVHNIGSSRKERKQMTVELLQRVGLGEEHFNRYPHEFSGGQRQRVVVARTLALKPELIICDESVSALDVSVQAQVLNLLNELKEDFGFTYVFISHDLSVVKFMSDRIIVMKAGEIVEAGEADSLYYKPQNEYTKTLIESIPKGL